MEELDIASEILKGKKEVSGVRCPSCGEYRKLFKNNICVICWKQTIIPDGKYLENITGSMFENSINIQEESH